MTAWDPATTHHLAVHGNFADTTNYKMIAKDSVFFNNTFVNRSAGELWPTAATLVREGAGVRAGSALPEALLLRQHVKATFRNPVALRCRSRL